MLEEVGGPHVIFQWLWSTHVMLMEFYKYEEIKRLWSTHVMRMEFYKYEEVERKAADAHAASYRAKAYIW